MTTLSPSQEQIRTSPITGRTFVEAGAGTGKTRVLISRAQYLIGQGLRPQEVLFLVFSQAARDELRRRLQGERLNCQVQTVHGFAVKEMSLGSDLNILPPEDPGWRKILFDLQLQFPRAGQQVAAMLELAWQAPLTELPVNLRTLRLAAEERLAQAGEDGYAAYTFTSLLATLLDHWDADPAALVRARLGFQAVIVDEVQDVSRLQARVIDRLAGETHLLMVGDPWQGIFFFQHATPQVLAELKEGCHRTYHLEEAYRSPAQHLMATEALTGRGMVPMRGFDGSFEVRRCGNQIEMYDAVQQVVPRLVKEGQVAVLAFTNQEVQEIASLLRELGLTIHVAGDARGPTDDYCQTILAPVTRLVTQKKRPVGRHPLLGLPDTILKVEWDWTDVDLLNAAWLTGRRAEEIAPHLPRDWRPLLRLWRTLQDWQGTPLGLLELLTVQIPGYPPSPLARHHAVKAHDLLTLFVRVGDLLPDDEHAITVSTFHRSKGLEWPNVVVIDSGRNNQFDSETELAEGARVRYVALTRSSRNLVVLLHAQSHPAFDLACSPEVLEEIRTCERAVWKGDWQAITWNDTAQKFRTVERYLREVRVPTGAIPSADGLIPLQPLRRIPLAGKKASNTG